MQIRNRYNDSVIFEGEYASIRLCVEAAVAQRVPLIGANLTYANLTYANLSDANLTDANLSYANLTDANLSDANLTYANLTYANLTYANLQDSTWIGDETWGDYKTKVVPALLTAGGKTIAQIIEAGAWECHDWTNCPMAVAFGVRDLKDLPALYRPRAKQFIQFFDAKMIPLSVIQSAKEEGEFV